MDNLLTPEELAALKEESADIRKTIRLDAYEYCKNLFDRVQCMPLVVLCFMLDKDGNASCDVIELHQEMMRYDKRLIYEGIAPGKMFALEMQHNANIVATAMMCESYVTPVTTSLDTDMKDVIRDYNEGKLDDKRQEGIVIAIETLDAVIETAFCKVIETPGLKVLSQPYWQQMNFSDYSQAKFLYTHVQMKAKMIRLSGKK